MPDAPKVRVLIVEDSEVVRMGLRALLGASPRIHVVGEAGSVADGIAAAVKLTPDVVLLDIRLPDGTGFDACRAIVRKQLDSRILILTSVADDALVDEAIRAGAHGYLLKEINGQGLIQAIQDVAAGKSILDPAITARIIGLMKSGATAHHDALSSLSPQERRVLSLIADGRTNKEVASELNLSEKTVKNYLTTVFEKLHVTRRTQAAALFAQESRAPRQPR
ncbi:MAG: response regulator transcription factor [Opitutaceae bacterium]|jgi:two-component system response regulator DevR